MFELIFLGILVVFLTLVFGKTEADYQKLERVKQKVVQDGYQPTAADQVANAGQGCMWLLSWIVFVFFVFMVLSVVSSAVMVGGL